MFNFFLYAFAIIGFASFVFAVLFVVWFILVLDHKDNYEEYIEDIDGGA